jgi:hypothetical protein
MNRSLLAIIAVFSTIAPSVVPAQSASASSRTREIAALFSKNKHVVKEKRGVRTEKYKNVSAEPLVAANPTILSGTYRAFDAGFVMQLSVSPDGTVNGSGTDLVDYDSRISRSFTLVDGKVRGALLTAAKLYRDGKRESFEGVFMERTSFESPRDPGTKVFGLGVLTRPMQIGGNTIDRLFYERAAGEMAQGNTGNR